MSVNLSNLTELRWKSLSDALGVSADETEFTRLTSAYSEPHRAYHNLRHLSECIEQLDWASSEGAIKDTATVEAALWYHDVIYKPRAKDNEKKSAEWAHHYFTEVGLDKTKCDLIHSLIMATTHGEKPTEAGHQLIVDIDLSILGKDEPRFSEYEEDVRKEYKWVPQIVYKRKRRELLEYFLGLPEIYNTKLFFARYEETARENIKQSIAKLV